ATTTAAATGTTAATAAGTAWSWRRPRGWSRGAWWWWTEGPVAVPGREVGDRHPPETLSRRVQRSQLLPLRIGDAQSRQGGARVGNTVTIHVKVRPAPCQAQNLDDSAILRWHPPALRAVIETGWDDATDGEVQEVLDVVKERLIELDGRRSGGDRFVR